MCEVLADRHALYAHVGISESWRHSRIYTQLRMEDKTELDFAHIFHALQCDFFRSKALTFTYTSGRVHYTYIRLRNSARENS